jgi:parvulin-like peptidyl-prolyl isomerase
VDRAVDRYPPVEQAKARAEIIDYLIDQALVDQYLLQQKIVAEDQEVAARLTEIEAELKKTGQTLPKLLQNFRMTEAEFRAQITADLRWEKFTSTQATDANLTALFEQNQDMFDGSRVHARHILIRPAHDDAKSLEAAKSEALKIRQQIEAAVNQALAKLPARADALAREKERTRALEDAFASAAKEKSACPSKRDGGDLNWFPRAGSMVEPFAKAAFALRPYELSAPVQTQFGYHLILVTERKAGQRMKFEDAKEEVREVYCNRLRESLAAQLRPTARISITPAKP